MPVARAKKLGILISGAESSKHPPLSFAELFAAFAPGPPGPAHDAAALAYVQQIISATVARWCRASRGEVLELRAHVELKLLQYLRKNELHGQNVKFQDDGRKSYGAWVAVFTLHRLVELYIQWQREKRGIAHLIQCALVASTSRKPCEEADLDRLLEDLPEQDRGAFLDMCEGHSREESARRLSITVFQLDQKRRSVRGSLWENFFK